MDDSLCGRLRWMATYSELAPKNLDRGASGATAVSLMLLVGTSII